VIGPLAAGAGAFPRAGRWTLMVAWLRRIVRRHPPAADTLARPVPPIVEELPVTIEAAAKIRRQAEALMRHAPTGRTVRTVIERIDQQDVLGVLENNDV
jgi:hypothetical protein